jgi:hypothetical protein
MGNLAISVIAAAVVAGLVASGRFRRRAELAGLTAVVLAVGAVASIALAYYQTFDFIQTNIGRVGQIFNLSPLLTNALATLFLVTAAVGIGIAFSVSERRRLLGIGLISKGIAAYVVLLLVGTGMTFDGGKLRCYTIGPDGVRFFDKQQIDPRTGEECQWVDRSNLPAIQAIDSKVRSGSPPRPLSYKSPDEVRFFARDADGSAIPLVWYHLTSAGRYELYDVPGRHPVLGVPLKPITRQVAERWLANVSETIKRDSKAISDFKRSNPCPATGLARGSCPGYVLDHIRPLCAGGSDTVANLQWQTTEEAKKKDQIKHAECRALRRAKI